MLELFLNFVLAPIAAACGVFFIYDGIHLATGALRGDPAPPIGPHPYRQLLLPLYSSPAGGVLVAIGTCMAGGVLIFLAGRSWFLAMRTGRDSA